MMRRGRFTYAKKSLQEAEHFVDFPPAVMATPITGSKKKSEESVGS